MRGEGNSSSVNTGGRMRLGDGAGGGLLLIVDRIGDGGDRTGDGELW